MTDRQVESAKYGAGCVGARIKLEAVKDGKGAGQAYIAPKVEWLSLDHDEECYATERTQRRQGSDNSAGRL